VPPDWWRSIFDEVYLQTDARSILDEDLTRAEVDAVIQALDLGREEAILDLCGGQGRHALEMARRGYRHQTPLPAQEAVGLAEQREYKDTPGEQVRILRAKGCGCRV
jgi:D-alanine-D-alanine ligase